MSQLLIISVPSSIHYLSKNEGVSLIFTDKTKEYENVDLTYLCGLVNVS